MKNVIQNTYICTIKDLTMDDKIIVDNLLSGNKRYETKLYNKYIQYVYNIVNKYNLSYDETEDVVSTTFIKVFNKLSSLKNPELLKWWIRSITINNTLNFIRNKNKIKLLEFHEQYYNIPEDVDNNVYFEELKDKLYQKIDNLADGYRDVINLHYFEGLKHKEIASHRNISVNTSKSQIFKARKILLNELQN
jgi:RNA polymerase sigma-70 factor (ECF subfamily)